MQLRESRMFKPIKAWLEAKGYRVVAEVPCYSSAIDVVGWKEDHVIGIEMKMTFTRHVIYQARRDFSFCDDMYVAVPTRPRDPSRCSKHGLGLLSVKYGRVAEIVKPKRPKNDYGVYAAHRNRIIEKCKRMPEGVGGMPCIKGKGPAQDCEKRVVEYRKTHPKATWREIFENVPNHYSSYKSMSQSLTIGLEFSRHVREMRERRGNR